MLYIGYRNRVFRKSTGISPLLPPFGPLFTTVERLLVPESASEPSILLSCGGLCGELYERRRYFTFLGRRAPGARRAGYSRSSPARGCNITPQHHPNIMPSYCVNGMLAITPPAPSSRPYIWGIPTGTAHGSAEWRACPPRTSSHLVGMLVALRELRGACLRAV